MRRRGVLLLALALTACVSHWRTQDGPTALVVTRSTGTEFRVTRKNGTRVNVDRPQVEGDSLIGRLPPMGAWPDTSARFAIPLAEIHSIAEKEADLVASIAIGTVITLGIILLLFRGIAR